MTETAPVLNLGLISKANAGAAAGILVSAGSVVGTIFTLMDPAARAAIPWWGYLLIFVVVAVLSAAVVFIGVYVAPKNTEPQIVAPEGTKVVPDPVALAAVKEKEKATS